MSDYYVRRTGDDDYLEHSIFQNGYHKGHKYIARMNIGGKMRYFYDPRELAVFKAGGRAAGAARRAIGGAVANVRRAGGKASRFIDRNITGASAKRRMNINLKRGERLDRSQSRSDNTLGNMAQKRAQKYQKQYNRSLFGRIENAGKRIANVGNSARNAVGNAAGQARRAGTNFVGTVSRNAYNAAQRAGKAIDRNITGASAKRRMNINLKRGERLDRSQSRSDNTLGNMAQKRAQKYQKQYNRSLFGRIDTAMDDASKWYEAQQSRAKRKIKKLKGKGKKASQDAYLWVKNKTGGKRA